MQTHTPTHGLDQQQLGFGLWSLLITVLRTQFRLSVCVHIYVCLMSLQECRRSGGSLISPMLTVVWSSSIRARASLHTSLCISLPRGLRDVDTLSECHYMSVSRFSSSSFSVFFWWWQSAFKFSPSEVSPTVDFIITYLHTFPRRFHFFKWYVCLWCCLWTTLTRDWQSISFGFQINLV